jgi:hypothetical protein
MADIGEYYAAQNKNSPINPMKWIWFKGFLWNLLPFTFFFLPALA